MTIEFPREVGQAVSEHPYPLVFATISGAHLYGFPSRDSDWDIRGVHVLPVREMLGLYDTRDTIEQGAKSPVELDVVTHDVRKFFGLLLKRNGYVLEQLYSPLIVKTSAEHAELKSIAKGCVTRFHSHHYLGFAATQWSHFDAETPPRVKPLLYTFRVLLTGIRLMNTGQIEANLLRLNEEFGLPYIDELVSRKIHGAEQGVLTEDDELQRYTQARIGNIHAPETTGKLIAATFEHDTARPVDGYAAPQLHTHAVIFNVTERDSGQTRALQERSLFQSQRYVTSVYRTELA